MALQIFIHPGVEVEYIQNVLFVGHIRKAAGRSHQSLHVEVIGIKKESDHRLDIIGVAALLGRVTLLGPFHWDDVQRWKVGRDDNAEFRNVGATLEVALACHGGTGELHHKRNECEAE